MDRSDITEDDFQARQRWGALGRKQRRRIVRNAKKGIACDDPVTAAIALGWAWAVLGAPERRRRFDWLDFLTPGPNPAFVDVYDGSRMFDTYRYVRRAAKNIDAVHTPLLP
ncbi:hypothetical protein ACEZCY_09195 [Streptacidiphilus sp. N1-12]|uniref:Uncharacterized protein n=2 Tax=Streptacidiphilus alkalitolerans TaxID=3342712 RepID=A0ABV6VH43_9ACTN